MQFLKVSQTGHSSTNRMQITFPNLFFQAFQIFDKRNQQAAETLDIGAFQLIGYRHLTIELGSKECATFYSDKWKNLVGNVATHVKTKMRGDGKELEERFILGIMQAMKKYGIRAGDVELGFLHSALDFMRFNCVHSTLLVYDVAQILQINVQLVQTREHMLLKTAHFYFDARYRKYGPVEKLPAMYPSHQVITCAQLHSSAHNSLGNAHFTHGRYHLALSEYTKALALNPGDYCALENGKEAEGRIRQNEKIGEDIPEALEVYM